MVVTSAVAHIKWWTSPGPLHDICAGPGNEVNLHTYTYTVQGLQSTHQRKSIFTETHSTKFLRFYFCRLHRQLALPYSGKFSRGPIFAEGQSSKIFADGRSRTAPPTIPGWLHLLLHAHAGSNRLIEGKMAHESHVIKAMIRGYHVYKEIWCAAVGVHKRRELSRSIHCSSGKIGSDRRLWCHLASNESLGCRRSFWFVRYFPLERTS